MAMTTKKPARLPSQRIQPLALQSKQRARPPLQAPDPDADPLGFAQVIAEISAQLEEAYHTRLRALLRKFDLLRFVPALRRSISAAVTAQGGPVSFDVTLTFYPPDASAFALVIGELKPHTAERSAKPQPAEPDDPDYGPWITGLFGERVRMRRPKGGWRKFPVADKLFGPENAGLMDWQILARVPSPASGVRRIPLRCG
jgi:hypothetical protein